MCAKTRRRLARRVRQPTMSDASPVTSSFTRLALGLIIGRLSAITRKGSAQSVMGIQGRAPWAPLTRGIADRARPFASLFVVGTVLFWASLYTYVPIFPAYIERLSGSLETVAWIVGAYGLTQLAFRIPLGVWSDRAGARKPFVLVGLVAAMVSGVGMAIVRAPILLFALRALAGTAAATWGLLTVLFAGYFAPPNPHRAMAIMQVASALAQIGAALLGGWVASRWGWTAPFYAGALLAMLGLALLLVKPLPQTKARPRRVQAVNNIAPLFPEKTFVFTHVGATNSLPESNHGLQ